MATFDPGALVEARAKKGMTQSRLAAAAGLSASLISCYENGHTTPRPTTAYKLADALGVSKQSLYKSNEVAA